MAALPQPELPDRPVRVSVPVRVEFSGDRFLITEFTANLSEGGLFLPTEHTVEPGARGRMTFRLTQWDEPFTVEAEVVRVESPGQDTERRGLGIRFVDLDPKHLEQLRRLVDGLLGGSMVEAIRRSIRESTRNMETELRRRPTDQKVMLANCARENEIEALIRDGHPTVLQRLLKNPRLRLPHVRSIVRDPRVPTRMLLDVKKCRQWFADEEVRFLFCRHSRAPFHETRTILQTLSIPKLQILGTDMNLLPQVRLRAREILRTKRSGGRV